MSQNKNYDSPKLKKTSLGEMNPFFQKPFRDI